MHTKMLLYSNSQVKQLMSILCIDQYHSFSQGSRGEKGSGGEKGDTGDPGINGAVGPPGVAGEKGPKGIVGVPGFMGTRGDPGEDVSYNPAHNKQLSVAGKSWCDWFFFILQGAKGVKGFMGEKGPFGDKVRCMQCRICDDVVCWFMYCCSCALIWNFDECGSILSFLCRVSKVKMVFLEPMVFLDYL